MNRYASVFTSGFESLVFVLIVTFMFFYSGWANAITPGSQPTFAVLGPLELTTPPEFTNFVTSLAQSKSIGVEAVSIDVWIGKVQPTSASNFDWTYYDDVFGRIMNAGLKIIPILAFHKCGGCPGDNCDIKIPPWVFNLAPDMKYESGKGNTHDDTVSVWATQEPAVLTAYENFYKEFGMHISGMTSDFVEINISLGATGELRYPSYNKVEWDYNTNSIGVFQFYSQRAGDDFRNYAMGLACGNLNVLNDRWGTILTSQNDIRVPQNHDQFIAARHYETTPYGRDLIDWYNGSLVEHGARLLNLAHAALAPTMPSACRNDKSFNVRGDCPIPKSFPDAGIEDVTVDVIDRHDVLDVSNAS